MAKDLTEDQERRIAETLRRIRAGLARVPVGAMDEPAHLFDPEALNDKK